MTGKSTLLELLEAVAGTANTSHVPFHSMSDIHARAEYQGKRLNISRDNSDQPMKSEDAFKSLVSCEMTTGRLLYHNRTDFISYVKFIFASNVPLHFAHPDDAVYDRLLVVPFERAIPDDKKDRELLNKLLKEKDVIFSAAIDQLPDLVASGYDFKEPEASKRIIELYRSALHTAESFLHDCYVVDSSGSVSSVKLYNHYLRWCEANGMEPDKKQMFYAKVRSYASGIDDSKVYSEGHRVNGFKGIRLKKTDTPANEQAETKADESSDSSLLMLARPPPLCTEKA
jgi:P4 family phage/plasmid primase-like protien